MQRHPTGPSGMLCLGHCSCGRSVAYRLGPEASGCKDICCPGQSLFGEAVHATGLAIPVGVLGQSGTGKSQCQALMPR